jgi:hypothetical protein
LVLGIGRTWFFLLIRCSLAGFSWVALSCGSAFSLDWLVVGAAPWGGALLGGIALSGCGGLVLAALGGKIGAGDLVNKLRVLLFRGVRNGWEREWEAADEAVVGGLSGVGRDAGGESIRA